MSQLLRDQRNQRASRQRTLQKEVRLLLQEKTILPIINESHPVRDAIEAVQTQRGQRLLHSDCESKTGRPQPLSSLVHLSACLDPNALDPSLLVCSEGHEISIHEYEMINSNH